MWAQCAGVLGWLLLLQAVPRAAGARPCSPKYFGRDSMVCVCNATYCDTLDPVVLPAPGTYVKYESSKAGKRLERSEGSFQRSLRAPGLLLTLNISALYQHVKGFGGSLSDAAALNILGLSQPAQDNLLQSYFSENGIEYNLVRVPMACSDFSVRPYSYDDVPYDYELKHFKLAEEDVKMKVPGRIRQAQPDLLGGDGAERAPRGALSAPPVPDHRLHRRAAAGLCGPGPGPCAGPELARHPAHHHGRPAHPPPRLGQSGPGQCHRCPLRGWRRRSLVPGQHRPSQLQPGGHPQALPQPFPPLHRGLQRFPHLSVLCVAGLLGARGPLQPQHPDGPEPLRGRLDRLEPGAGPSGGPQLGRELRGQPRHRGQQQGRLLQAAHVLPHGALQQVHPRGLAARGAAQQPPVPLLPAGARGTAAP
ncbi:collagen alpha-2(I) chain-like isoform X2 [Anas acuta]|uniref:collagen alpha-2(I) chain-like isoform X2 n=1 Tax=Anas acuta TaxID=28680 RepID=UPI0035C8FA23